MYTLLLHMWHNLIVPTKKKTVQSLYLLLLLLPLLSSSFGYFNVLRLLLLGLNNPLPWCPMEVYRMERKRKIHRLSKARVFPLRPERNFVLICSKVLLVRNMPCVSPALWSRLVLVGVSPCWRRRWLGNALRKTPRSVRGSPARLVRPNAITNPCGMCLFASYSRNTKDVNCNNLWVIIKWMKLFTSFFFHVSLRLKAHARSCASDLCPFGPVGDSLLCALTEKAARDRPCLLLQAV